MKDINLEYFNQSCHLLQQNVQKPERYPHQLLEMGSVYKLQVASDR